MRITVISVCYNEADLIPYWIRHYSQFCDRLVILDNHSTDNGLEIARDHGVEVKTFGQPKFDDVTNSQVKSLAWQDYRDSDLVIVTDLDEFLFVPEVDPKDYKEWFDKNRGYYYPVEGYQMADNVPFEQLDEPIQVKHNTGHPSVGYAKLVIFNPQVFESIQFSPGQHSFTAYLQAGFAFEGNGEDWNLPEELSGPKLALCNYRPIGGPDRLVERAKMYARRMSQANKKNRMGVHYLWPEGAEDVGSPENPSVRWGWRESMNQSEKLDIFP